MKSIDVKIMDSNFQLIGIIDAYESLIWTERYYEAGDFEIYLEPNDDTFYLIENGAYAMIDGSNAVMVMEKSGYQTDNEDGDKMLISGRGLSSILDRRIIWEQTEIGQGDFKNLQTAIRKLINESIISPKIEERKIPNFFFVVSTDERVTSIELDDDEVAQYYGDSLYESIASLCENHKIGFRIDLDDENNFQFLLYKGNDRSYGQNENPYVVFSDEFDNVATFSYTKDNADYRNVALVVGEENGSSKTNVVIGDASGLDRREYYDNAGSEVSKTVNGKTLTVNEYKTRLGAHGADQLEKHRVQEECECEVDPDIFVANQDYWIGDIIQLGMKYGISVKARVIEIIYNLDESGYKVYPTFEMLINGED